MLRRRYQLIGPCLALLFAACVAAPPATPTGVLPTTSRAGPTATTPALTTTRLPISTPTPSAAALNATRGPSPTPRHYEFTQEAIAVASEPTGTPLPPPTGTFDPQHIVWRTSAPPAQCPAVKPELTPDFTLDQFTAESVAAFYQQVLDFLNAGGPPQAVIKAYGQHSSRADISDIQETDVTGDGIPDLLLTEPDTFNAFVCGNGQYQELGLIGETYHFAQPFIVTIADMNRDGVDEILTIDGDDRIREIHVFEWDGAEFQDLTMIVSQGNCSELLGPDSWPYAQDTNGDGTLELVLKQGIPIWSEYVDGLPWRNETRTCTWDGTGFVLTSTEITGPPEYRFQAVQDGDRASLAGDDTKAVDLYQQAVFSDTLEAWSFDRFIYEGELTRENDPGAPTLMPLPTPDPAEYPSLAAYARYRIMLLYVVRGDLADAKTVYDTLQAKFPASQVGHADAEMATAFWIEYQASHSLAQACGKAIDYATQHPADILTYLGRSDYSRNPFGDQSLTYTPADVCPFQ